MHSDPAGFILFFSSRGAFSAFRSRRKSAGRILPVFCAVLTAVFLLSAFPAAAEDADAAENPAVPAPDFTLTDQYGEEHTLSAYRGKAVFLNFWTTWCPWCRTEMPDIESLYHELGENREDVVFLGMAAPGSHDTADEDGVVSFLEENGWTYPVLMDPDGTLFSVYGVQAFPTTWLIRPDGTLLGYVPGTLTKDQMASLVEMALE